MPQRAASSACSRPSAQRSGALLALVVGRGALQQHRAAVVAHRADLGDLVVAEHAARPARRPAPRACARSAWRPRPASWISVGATHSTAAWARFHAHASWSGVSPWRSAIGRIRSSFGRARPRPSPRAGSRGGRARSKLVSREHVVVEEAAVVDDPREHLHVVPRRGVERQLAGPGLERVQDQHRPVDQLAVALEAADHVEREAVGRAGREAESRVRPSSRRRAQGLPHLRATRSRGGRGCGAAAGRTSPRRSARGCARPPCAGSRGSRRGRAGAGR